eukprot:TRINITY_DN618_c9_g1_i1.p1 TRINITY_DN618_c9_g1~~TRINITY_DN618_c9_g1_i1.p1  ORF type:complete len:625 (-),score=247.63 TRINITY_DN618_c9_g1_i1:139-1980(-)
MKVVIALLFISFVFCVYSHEKVLVRSRHNIPLEWNKNERVEVDRNVEFTIALRQRNLDQLNAVYEDVTNPHSRNYRKWLTIEEVQQIVAPPVSEVKPVMKWLAEANIQFKLYGDFIKCSGAAADVEALFETELYYYTHKIGFGETVVRQFGSSFIPAELDDIIDMVTGLSEFVPAAAKLSRRAPRQTLDTLDYYVVPQTIRELYNVSESLTATNPKSSQAVVEFGKRSGILFDDLFQFQSLTGQAQQNVSYIVGPFRWSSINPIDDESSLDIQYIMAMAPNAPTSYYTVDGWIYDFCTLVQQRQNDNQDVPLVFSLSYGWSEQDQCEITGDGESCLQLGGNSLNYVNRTNIELQKLSVTSVSVVVASGDAGAASKWNSKCDKTPALSSEYPAGSPFVTTVGATMLDPFKTMSNVNNPPPFCTNNPDVPCASGGTEIACSIPYAAITVGGGFSAVAPRPEYQNSAVNNWLSQNCLQPNAGDFNPNNYGQPDIATLGHSYMIVHDGKTLPVDGTSASAPVFAGLLTLINDQELNAGRPPIGFFNPTLYALHAQTPTFVQDITVGNNTRTISGFLKPDGCSVDGYGACDGWDPVSGFGTPNFGIMANLIASNSNNN